MKQIKKLLVANRGEIAIRIFRAAAELDISTVAIYSNEDKSSLHRYKADESYLVGSDLGPAESYLNIERIIDVAKQANVDAIHPGYGFLSENEQFARRCAEEGIKFIGPHLEHLDMFGDKVKARTTAIKADLPVIPGTDGPIKSYELAKELNKTNKEMTDFIVHKSMKKLKIAQAIKKNPMAFCNSFNVGSTVA